MCVSGPGPSEGNLVVAYRTQTTEAKGVVRDREIQGGGEAELRLTQIEDRVPKELKSLEV